MPLPKPTSEELARHAERIGFRIDAAEIDDYTALVSAMLEAYDAVDSVEEQPVLATRERVESRVPPADEDPHHAWYVRTSIRGAAEGPLAGVRLADEPDLPAVGVFSDMSRSPAEALGFLPVTRFTLWHRPRL